MCKESEVLISCYMDTTKKWYPEFVTTEGVSLVNASLLYDPACEGDPDMWRVALWGGDDMGVEKEFYSYQEAIDEFIRLMRGPVDDEKIRDYATA